ncbi:MAG: hypothetical protein ACJ8BC_09365, partial [Gemmatimonadales bacterium]
MPASRRFLGILALLSVAGSHRLRAEIPVDGITSRAADLVDHMRGLITGFSRPDRLHQAEARVRPQEIATGGATVDLSHLSQPTLIEDRLSSALHQSSGELRLTIPGGAARRGDFSLGSTETRSGHLLVLDGNADIYGHLNGNLVTVRGDVVVHPGGVVGGDVLTLGGRVRDEGGEIGGEVRTLRSTTLLSPAARPAPPPLSAWETVLRRTAGVLGVFLSLTLLGFGLVLFGRQNLEIVSDTVSHSFGRAFVTGLLGQILLLPTFGMLVVGLILSVAGILLLP